MNNQELTIEQQLEQELNQSVADQSTKSRIFLDLLHETFGPDDLVQIHNFTDRPTGYIYSDRGSLRVESNGEMVRRVYPGAKKSRIIRAGATITVQGWEAYIGLDKFFKQWVQDSGQELAISINSPEIQRKFLKLAYAGLFDPNVLVDTTKYTKGKKKTAKSTEEKTVEEKIEEQVADSVDDLGLI